MAFPYPCMVTAWENERIWDQKDLHSTPGSPT